MDGERLLGGRYRMVERLGVGGMSVVWRGRDEVLARQVAVKVLDPELAADDLFRQRIRIEARSAAQLSHPHITNVYDYGESTVPEGVTVPYVVMELVEGQTLSSRLAMGPLPWRDAALVCAQVAAALAAAHAHGVVHRDITPGNVMLTRAGAKVVDFGISALAGEIDLDTDGNLLGTPAYLAPERIDGRPVVPASDVYALGVVFYRALTGRLPWSAATTDGILLAHLSSPPQPLPAIDGMPPELAALCLECLDKRPDGRPNAADVARRLSEAIGVPVPLGPPVTVPALPVGLRAAAPTVTRWMTGSVARPEAADEPTLTGLMARSRRIGGWLTSVLHSPGVVREPSGRRGRFVTMLATAALLLLTAVGWAGASGGPGSSGGGRALGYALPGEAGCLVQYQVQRDWGTGFTVALTVTNADDEPVDGWRLTFAFPGEQRVTTARAVRWSQDGRAVTAGPTDPDGWLDAGGSVSFDLTASYRGGNPLPVAFTLDGRDCQALVAGTPGSVPKPAGTGAAPPSGGEAAAPDKDNGKHKGRDRD